jgi:hypothetical protein
MATTANNKEVCSTRRLDQCWSGMALDDHGFELYPVKGTPYLFDSVFEHLVGVGFGVVIIGASGFSVGLRVKLESAAVEVDSSLEVLAVAKAAR